MASFTVYRGNSNRFLIFSTCSESEFACKKGCTQHKARLLRGKPVVPSSSNELYRSFYRKRRRIDDDKNREIRSVRLLVRRNEGTYEVFRHGFRKRKVRE